MAMVSFSTAIALDGKLEAISSKHLVDSHRATSQKPDNAFVVDLDAEKGQTPKENRDNKHRVAIKFAKKIQLATVRAYLEGQIDFDNGVLEGISKTLSLSIVTRALLIPFRLP